METISEKKVCLNMMLWKESRKKDRGDALRESGLSTGAFKQKSKPSFSQKITKKNREGPDTRLCMILST